MQIHLKNFGVLHEADIAMPGLSVVVGETGTGRHTLCRAAFTLTDLLGGCGFATTVTQRQAVHAAVERFYYRWQDENQSEYDLQDIDCRLNRAALKGGRPVILRELYNWMDDCGMGYDDEEAEDLAQYAAAVFLGTAIPADAVETVFYDEFRDWLPRAGEGKTVELQLTQEGKVTDVRFSPTDGMTVTNACKRTGQACFLGTDVSAAWNWASCHSVPSFFFPERVNRILRRLMNGSTAEISPAVKALLPQWQAFCGGRLSRGFMEAVFQPQTGTAEFPPSALPAGFKMPVILETLLEDGVIKEGDAVIWEAPESHLHPREQVRLAELLVQLQKALRLHVLITTDSPYFAGALEIYGRKYGTSDDGRWYLMERTDAGSVVRNVTGHVAEIYDSLAAPYQTIEDEAMSWEWRSEG